MDENVFLLHSFLLGVGITFLYDILRILRRVFAHSTSMVSLEDLAFWIYCAGKVFLLMFHEVTGTCDGLPCWGHWRECTCITGQSVPFL